MVGSPRASRHKTELAAKATRARTVRDAMLIFGLDDLDIQLPRQDAILYMPCAMQLLPLGYLASSQTSWFDSSDLLRLPLPAGLLKESHIIFWDGVSYPV